MLTYIIYCLDAYIYIICFVFYTNQRFHSMFFSILMIYLNTIKMDLRAHTHISTHPNIPDQEQTSNLRRPSSRFSDRMMLLRSHAVSGRTVIRIMTASLDVQTTCCLKLMMSFDLSAYMYFL